MNSEEPVIQLKVGNGSFKKKKIVNFRACQPASFLIKKKKIKAPTVFLQ